MKSKITRYFDDYIQSHELPSGIKSTIPGVPDAPWFLNARLSFFTNPEFIGVDEMDYTHIHPFHRRLVVVSPRQPASLLVIVAHDEQDDRILWLDNHLHNQDFLEFAAKEAIVEREVSEVCRILAEINLAYLGWPSLVERDEDFYRPAMRHRLVTTPNAEATIRDVSTQIQPATAIRTGDVIAGTFYIWTRIYGCVFKMDFRYINGTSLDYTAEKIACKVGFWRNL